MAKQKDEQKVNGTETPFADAQAPLTLDAFLDTDDVEYETVQTRKGPVRLGSLDAGMLLDFIEANEGPSKKMAGIRLVAASLVDAQGNRLGVDAQRNFLPGILDRLKAKDARTMNMLVDAVMKLNGMSGAAKEDAKND